MQNYVLEQMNVQLFLVSRDSKNNPEDNEQIISKSLTRKLNETPTWKTIKNKSKEANIFWLAFARPVFNTTSKIREKTENSDGGIQENAYASSKKTEMQ